MTKVQSRGVKDLKISAPTRVGQVNSKIRGKIILVTKYDFLAESRDELCVKKGDVLKLLDRLPHGWVLVEFIDKIASPGLVPSLYVDIAVNDPIHPITLRWLHEVKTKETLSNSTFYDVQVQILLERNEPLTINNKPYPLTVSVSNYLTFQDRFWYRVDVTYSTGEQGYHCRYYLDFYDLHLLLLEFVNKIDPNDVEMSQLKLPKLPEPVPSQRRTSAEQSELFSKRCKELSLYMETLMNSKRFKVCAALVDWLSASYKKLPGFVVEDPLNTTSDDINQRILPGSIVLASKPKFTSDPTLNLKKPLEETKHSAPARAASQKAGSKNTYNHYQQAANFTNGVGRSMSTSDGGVTRKGTVLGRSRTLSNPGHSQRREQRPQFPGGSAPPTPQMHKINEASGSSPKFFPGEISTLGEKEDFSTKATMIPGANLESPRMLHTKRFNSHPPSHNHGSPSHNHGSPSYNHGSPSFNPESPSYNHESPSSSKYSQTPPLLATPKMQLDSLLQCKIKTQTNDNVIIRVDARSIHNHEDFKTLIYQKVAFNNLFVKLPGTEAYEEVDSLDSLDTLLSSDKVRLLVT